MKGLTLKQTEKFKELYLKDYSASMIFKELGQDYGIKTWLANGRMRRYRILFNLPKRGIGYKPKIKRIAEPKITVAMKREKRIEKLTFMIPRWEKQLTLWKKELQCLANEKKGEL